MDKIQDELHGMYGKHKELFADRNRLRSALSDFIPNDKRIQNLILNAYDEDVTLN